MRFKIALWLKIAPWLKLSRSKSYLYWPTGWPEVTGILVHVTHTHTSFSCWLRTSSGTCARPAFHRRCRVTSSLGHRSSIALVWVWDDWTVADEVQHLAFNENISGKPQTLLVEEHNLVGASVDTSVGRFVRSPSGPKNRENQPSWVLSWGLSWALSWTQS